MGLGCGLRGCLSGRLSDDGVVLDHTEQHEGAVRPGKRAGESAHVGLGSKSRTRVKGLRVSREPAAHAKRVEAPLKWLLREMTKSQAGVVWGASWGSQIG